MRNRRFEFDPLEALRRRLIKETEIALLYGLRFPERMTRIPTVEVGHGCFDPAFAAHFWSETLGLDEAGWAALEGGGRFVRTGGVRVGQEPRTFSPRFRAGAERAGEL